LAKYYIKLLTDGGIIVPGGQYQLLGWSHGANVAYEMTQLLEEMKIRVLNTYLVDPVVTTLLDESSHSLDPWIDHYYPESTSQRITLFKCIGLDANDEMLKAVVQQAHSGFDKITRNLNEITLECSHSQAIRDLKSREVIVRAIRNDNIEGLAFAVSDAMRAPDSEANDSYFVHDLAV
jgi:thioesterase domain-containing protein